ncbi:hypothetical protein V8E36_006257 [Tilletia maclaganii]
MNELRPSGSQASEDHAFFRPGPASRPCDSYPEGSNPPSSQPSAYSSDPHFLSHRISVWLAGDGPGDVARRWSGMDAFAVDHVIKLIQKEVKTVSTDSYLVGPSARKVCAKDFSDYEPLTALEIIKQNAPVLVKVIHATAGAELEQDKSADEPPTKRRRTATSISDDVLTSESEEEDGGEGEDGRLEDDDAGEDDEWEDMEGLEGRSSMGKKKGGRKQKKKQARFDQRGTRNKSVVAFVAIHLLLFAFSRNCNRFQQALGLVMYASRTGKKPMDLMARAGVLASHRTIRRQAKSIAADSMSNARRTLRKPGAVVSLSIDNLNWLSTLRDKTSTHRNQMMAAVAGNMYVIDGSTRYDTSAPVCSDDMFQHVFGMDLERPTSVARPLSPLDANGRPLAMDRARKAENRSAALSLGGPDPYVFIIDDVDQEHLIQSTVAHALRSWVEHRPDCSQLKTGVPRPPQIFPLVPQKTKVLPIPVYDEDEGSILGNIRVLDAIIKDFGLDEQWLKEHVVPAVGDAFTATLQRKAIERREDDRSPLREQGRLTFLHPWAAMFHFKMAYQKFVVESHGGSSTAQDLLSLRRLSNKAGYKNLTTGSPDYHDVDAFLHVLFAAMSETILNGALRKAGHGRGPSTAVDDEDTTMVEAAGQDETVAADSTLIEGIEGVAAVPLREQTQAMPDGGARAIEYDPTEFAELELEDLHSVALEAIRSVLEGSVASICQVGDASKTDLLLGHAVSLYRDVAVYIELRNAIKTGDPGRAFAMARQALPRFQSNNANRYVIEGTTILSDLRCELTPELKQVMMGASLVNHKGAADSFLEADLDIEHIVNDLKNTFPVQGKAGGLERQRRIGELLPMLRSAKAQWWRLFSLTNQGGQHSTRDASSTVRTLASEMEEYAVLEKQASGRASAAFEMHISGEKRTGKRKQLATDHVAAGIDGLVGTATSTGSIKGVFERRQQGSVAVQAEDEDANTGIRIDFDADYDAGGFVALDVDI